MKVDPLHDPLEGLSPSLYLATLAEVAHVDGLHPAEEDLLERYADYFGVDLNDLPKVPEDLSTLPWATRVLVYRDAVTLALVGGKSGAEEQHLRDLAARMAMPPATASAVSAWVSDYDALLERLETLLSE